MTALNVLFLMALAALAVYVSWTAAEKKRRSQPATVGHVEDVEGVWLSIVDTVRQIQDGQRQVNDNLRHMADQLTNIDGRLEGWFADVERRLDELSPD